MSRTVTDHGSPDRFVAGTIGLPGDRTFYLQSRKGPDVQTVVLEKEQVALLAEKLVEIVERPPTKFCGCCRRAVEAPR